MHVLLLRDPYRFAGVDHCLSFAVGKVVRVADTGEALTYLVANAEQLWHADDVHLFKLGDVGFMWDIPRPCLQTFWR